MVTGGGLGSPGPDCTIGSPCGLLPLGLCGKSAAAPVAVVCRLLPGQAGHWMLGIFFVRCAFGGSGTGTGVDADRVGSDGHLVGADAERGQLNLVCRAAIGEVRCGSTHPELTGSNRAAPIRAVHRAHRAACGPRLHLAGRVMC